MKGFIQHFAKLFMLLLLMPSWGFGFGVSVDIETLARDHPERITRLSDSLNLPFLEDAGKPSPREKALALAAYFESRPWPEADATPLPSSPEALRELLDRSEKALNRWFTLQGIEARQPLRKNSSGLNWMHKGPRNDSEWAWFLNRHDFLLDWLHAWKCTGDIRFRQAINQTLCDWILSNPYPDRITFSAPWRPLEVARRIEDVWPELLRSDVLDSGSRVLMLSSVLDHADSLREHPSLFGNHRLTETVMLARLARLFPEFREASSWLDYANREVDRLIIAQTYPDGSYRELSNHYQWIALKGFSHFYAISAQNAPPSERFVRRLAAMWDYFAAVQRPDGTGPLNNDSDIEPNREWVRQFRPLLPVSEAPAVSAFFPWAGHIVLADGSDDQANWSFFDVGPLGTQHEHYDFLHLSIDLAGSPFLVDNGRYTYKAGAWRDYFRGPSGHNVLLINGIAPRVPPREVSQPLPAFFDNSPRRVKARASADRHTREVRMEKGLGWIVLDEVVAFEPHYTETLWHFSPDVAVKAAPCGFSARFPTSRGELEAVLKPFRYDYDQRRFLPLTTGCEWKLYKGSERPVAGWYSPRFNEKIPAFQISLLQRSAAPTLTAWIIAEEGQKSRALEYLLSEINPALPLRGSVFP